MGIDPGTHRLGFGVIEVNGREMRLVEYGCLEQAKGVLVGDHLIEIEQKITDLIARVHPDGVAVEELFFMRNVTTGLKVAEARGVVILAARKAKMPIAEYKPNFIKSMVAGYGLAAKDQVGRMVKTLLHLDHIPRPDDSADALAVALCHAYAIKNPLIALNQ